MVRTVASAGTGIVECSKAIEEYRLFLTTSQFQRDRSIQVHKDRLLEVICWQTLQGLLRNSRTAARIEELARAITDRTLDPFTAAEEIMGVSEDRTLDTPD